MPRIYNATFQPFTYEELATPLREATAAHQKVEEDYNNNMLVVDSLRRRAASELETNPESKWAAGILNYADQLEQYAGDLARNGLTRQTRNDLLNMKRGYGTTVSPVLMAMQREKELQSVRDKAVGTNMVFGRMPSLDEIISNPNIGQVGYNGDDLYKRAHDAAKAASERNIQIIKPRNLDAWRYEYGKKKGFSNDEINSLLNNEPAFAEMFGSIVNASGFTGDSSLDDNQRNQLYNQIISGALSGFSYDEDWHYANRTDNPYAALDHELKKRQLSSYDTPVVQTDPRKQRLPELDFGIIPLQRNQIDNNDARNRIINNKNIVTGVVNDVNGTHYQISRDYAKTIIDGLNGKKPKEDSWSNFYIYSPTTGGMNRNLGEQYISDSINKTASYYGITKNDSVESAMKKIQKFLENSADYTDMADATLHTGLRVRIDSENYNDVKSHYEKKNGSLDIQQLGPDGQYLSTGKTLKKEDYDPVYVFVDQNGPYQVWMNKKGDTEVTPYYDHTAYSRISDAYNGSTGVLYYQKQQNKLFNDFGKSIKLTGIDDLDSNRLRMIGYDKGSVMQYINNSGNSTKENMNLVYKINEMLARYYEAEAAEYKYYYDNAIDPQEKNMYAKQYNVALARQGNAEEQIQLLNTLSAKIDQAAAGINEMVMTDVPVTNQYTGQKYQGNTFKP